MPVKLSLQWLNFDSTESYEDIYNLQKRLVEDRIEGKIPDTLILGEHPHVITTGRGGKTENILKTTGIPLFEIERGGDVTYHGPGQLVGYPILQLQKDERDLHRYLRNLEEVLIRVLKKYNIQGKRKPGWTGVWVKEQKIASIGVAIRKWVTYHGFALNVSTDLSCFNHINPCGLPADVMISLEKLIPENNLAVEDVKKLVLKEFEEVFNRSTSANLEEPDLTYAHH